MTTVNFVPEDNDNLPVRREPGANVEIAMSRAAQEVQAAMAIAKRFPRNEDEAWRRIQQACKRKSLADCALYAYPKGGQTVTGPSIRLAECLAQAWGNIDSGIVELEQRKGESTMMAYCWDLETNSRNTKIFQVPHIRHTKSGDYKLTDPREIYEMTANQGSRRLRACILAVIPGDVVDNAVAECEKTMAGETKEPLVDRARKMVSGFDELGMGITLAHIEKRLGHNLAATSETELAGMRKIYRSLKDNMAAPGDFFDMGGMATGTTVQSQEIKDRLKGKPKAAEIAIDKSTNAQAETLGSVLTELQQPESLDTSDAQAPATDGGQQGESGAIDEAEARNIRLGEALGQDWPVWGNAIVSEMVADGADKAAADKALGLEILKLGKTGKEDAVSQEGRKLLARKLITPATATTEDEPKRPAKRK